MRRTRCIGLLITLLLVVITQSQCVFKGSKQPARTVNVLCLGNSYTVDAFAYVPCLLQQAAPDVQFNFCLLHRNKFTLKDHYEQGILEDRMYAAFILNNNDKKWCSTKLTLPKALESRDWDLIVVQQGSLDSREYARYQPYLDEVVEWLLKRVDKSTRLAWLLTPAWPDGCHGLRGEPSDSMACDILRCAQRLMAEEPFEILIPVGVAVQHARNMGLDHVGDYGDMCYDEFHLQDGLPRLTAALATATELMSWCGLDWKRLMESQKLVLNEEWMEQWAIPQRHGKPINVSAQAFNKAWKAVERAHESPVWGTVQYGYMIASEM